MSSKEQIIKKLQVREEYMSKFKLPPMLFSDELLTEVEPFMPIVMDILEERYRLHTILKQKMHSKTHKRLTCP